METREREWRERRLGRITASELSNLFSASGKVIDTNVDYIRHKRFEREHGYVLPVSARAMEIGVEQEKYAYEWLKANYPELGLKYAQEQSVIPVWKAEWGEFSASPDTFTEDESLVVEIKTVVGNTAYEYYADRRTSEEDIRATVIGEHGYQICGQFLSNPRVREIWLLKYLYMHDDIEDDLDSPIEPWRGVVVKFRREDFDLDMVRERIELFDRFIDSDYDAKAFKKGKWSIADGELVCV